MVTRFGAILNDTPTVQVNIIGTALNIGYICFFYCYTNNVKEKTLAFTQMGYAGAFLAAIFAYTFVENPEVLPFRYGLILTAVLFYVVGSPLLSLVWHYFWHFLSILIFNSNLQGTFIRNKSTEGLPFPIILTGTLISFLWFLYGVVSRENFVIVQNGVIFVMSAIQLSLFAIYPSKPSKPAKAKKSPSPSKNNNNKKKD